MNILDQITFRVADPEKDLAAAYDIFKRTIRSAVEELNGGVWPEDERYPFFKKGFSEPGMHMIEARGAPIGCYNITETDRTVVLQRVYLEPEYQNRGIGKHLIKMAHEAAVKANKPLELEVLANNYQALAAYKKAGFVAYKFAVNGWNRKWLMRQDSTDHLGAEGPILSQIRYQPPHRPVNKYNFV